MSPGLRHRIRHTRHGERRYSGLALVQIAGLLLIMGAIFAQSFASAVSVVHAQRQGCLAFDRLVLVPLLNAQRANYEGDIAIFRDPAQSRHTRNARWTEAQRELHTLLQIDYRLDPRELAGLNPVGTKYVRQLQRRGEAFSCVAAYPDPSPFRLLGAVGLG